MLKLPLLREVGGSLRPRKEGPLIEGELSVLRGSCGGAGGRVAVAVAALWGAAGEPRSVRDAAGAGDRRVPPHIPQNRIESGLSLPQRGQRTGFSLLIAYDILRVCCRIEMGCGCPLPRFT